MGLLEILTITAPLWAILCAIIASANQRNVGAWALSGLVLGLVAVVILVAIGKPTRISSDGASMRAARAADDPSLGVYGPDERDADLMER